MTSITVDGVKLPAEYGSTVLDKDTENTTGENVECESIFTAASNPTSLPEHSGFHLFDKVEWNPEIGDAIRCKGALSKAGDAIGGVFRSIGNFFGNIFNAIGSFFSGIFGKKEEVDDDIETEEIEDNTAKNTRFEGIPDEIIEKWGSFAEPYGDIYYDTDGELIVETRISDHDDEMKDFYALHIGEVRYDYVDDDGRRILGIAVNVENKNPSEKNLATRDGEIGATEQGETGDCWLLSGVNALSYTEEGRKIIKDALEYHDGYTTVHLKGAKDYEITNEEVEQARLKKYSTGDDDMLILELAIQKAFEDIDNKNLILGSVNTNSSIADRDGTIANGSHSENLLYLITGKESDYNFETIVNFDGNWDKTLSETFDDFMLNGKENLPTVLSALNETVIQDVDGNDVQIYAPHAYALKEATDDTITFTNPHNSGADITVSRESAFNAFDIYENCDLSDNNPDCEPPTFPNKVYEDGTKMYDESFKHRDYDETKAVLYSKDGKTLNTICCLSFESGSENISKMTPGQEWEEFKIPENSTASGKEIVNKIMERDLIKRYDLSLEEIVKYASLSDSEWQQAEKSLN